MEILWLIYDYLNYYYVTLYIHIDKQLLQILKNIHYIIDPKI